jgi:hypothetical protein
MAASVRNAGKGASMPPGWEVQHLRQSFCQERALRLQAEEDLRALRTKTTGDLQQKQCELDAIKRKLAEALEEAEALRDMQSGQFTLVPSASLAESTPTTHEQNTVASLRRGHATTAQSESDMDNTDTMCESAREALASLSRAETLASRLTQRPQQQFTTATTTNNNNSNNTNAKNGSWFAAANGLLSKALPFGCGSNTDKENMGNMQQQQQYSQPTVQQQPPEWR